MEDAESREGAGRRGADRRLRSSEALLVADYRGLTNSQLAGLRVKLIEHGAKLSVVKNTLTRRAASAAGLGGAARAARGADRDRVRHVRGRPRRRRQGTVRHGQGHEDPGPSWRGAVRQLDHGRRDRAARQATAARRPAGAARGRDRGPADPARGAAERAAAEPGRPDRRQDRAARGERRHFGAAVEAEEPVAEESVADIPAAEAESSAKASRPPRSRPEAEADATEDTPEA